MLPKIYNLYDYLSRLFSHSNHFQFCIIQSFLRQFFFPFISLYHYLSVSRGACLFPYFIVYLSPAGPVYFLISLFICLPRGLFISLYHCLSVSRGACLFPYIIVYLSPAGPVYLSPAGPVYLFISCLFVLVARLCA